MIRKIQLLAVVLAVSVHGLAGAAGPYGALECYDVHDFRPRAAVPRFDLSPKDLGRFAAEQNCTLVGSQPRAKQVCTPVATNPTGTPTGADLKSSFLCYKLRCAGADRNVNIQQKDLFGQGPFQLRQKSTKRTLCFPTMVIGSPSGAYLDGDVGL